MNSILLGFASSLLAFSAGISGGDSTSDEPAAQEASVQSGLKLQRVTLKHASADRVMKTLVPLARPGSTIQADPRTNTLILKMSAAEFDALADVIAALDAPVASPAQATQEPGSVTVNVAIVELSAKKLAALEIPAASLGSRGVVDVAAQKLTALADGVSDDETTIYANVTSVVPFGKDVNLSRSVQYPTQSVSTSGTGIAQSGFGGFVDVSNKIQVGAQTATADRIRISLSYEISRPVSTQTVPPVKASQRGNSEFLLRPGELAVTGGRLSSEQDSRSIFVIVRLGLQN